MNILKKVIGLLLIGVCVFVVLHPAITAGITIYVLVKVVEVLMLWCLANVISKLLFGMSLREFLFEDRDE